MCLFNLKNWGKILLYERRKDGHLRTPRLQFLRRDQRGLRLPRVGIDSQFARSPSGHFSYLLQQKVAPIFQIKKPLFWEKGQISASLTLRFFFSCDCCKLFFLRLLQAVDDVLLQQHIRRRTFSFSVRASPAILSWPG